MTGAPQQERSQVPPADSRRPAEGETPTGLITLGATDAVVCEGDTCWIPPVGD